MSKARDEAIRQMSRAGVSEYHQSKLLRLGATLHRLAEAQCNGDWPADDGERRGVVECGVETLRGGSTVRAVGRGCGSLWVPSVLRKSRGYLCPDCCATEDARKVASEAGFQAVIQGDPRGAVLCLAPKGTSREDIDRGGVLLVYVR